MLRFPPAIDVIPMARSHVARELAKLGREPERPAEFQDLERLPQRFTLIEPDAEAVKRYIASH